MISRTDIYNADETGLYLRALPNRSMVIKGTLERVSRRQRNASRFCWRVLPQAWRPLSSGKRPTRDAFEVSTRCCFRLRTRQTGRHGWWASCSQSGSIDSMPGWNLRSATFIDNCDIPQAPAVQHQACIPSPEYDITSPAVQCCNHCDCEVALLETLGATCPCGDGHSKLAESMFGSHPASLSLFWRVFSQSEANQSHDATCCLGSCLYYSKLLLRRTVWQPIN